MPYQASFDSAAEPISATSVPERGCPGNRFARVPRGRGLCPPSRGPALGRLTPEGILPLPAPPRGTSSLGGWMLFRPPGLHSPSGALRCLAAPARLAPCLARNLDGSRSCRSGAYRFSPRLHPQWLHHAKRNTNHSTIEPTKNPTTAIVGWGWHVRSLLDIHLHRNSETIDHASFDCATEHSTQ